LLDAVERGEALAKHQHPFVPFPPGEIYHRLGVLHLDPYVAGRASASYQQQMQLWQSRLYEEYGLALSADAITQRKLPDPQDALHKAVTYLETAASLRSGEPRGRTLKAMVQALHWIETLGGKSDIGVLTEAAREARSLLSEDCYPVEFYELTLLLDFHTKSFGEAAKKEMDLRARRLLETPASVWTKRLGKTETYDRFLMTAEAIRHSNPELALQVWRAAKPVLTEEDEDLKNSYYVAGTYFVRDALARKAPDPSGKPITDLIHTINVTAKKRNWSTQVVAACLFWIAASSASRNQEHQRLIALDLCLRKDKSFARKFSDLIAWTRATLELGAAVNAYNQDRFEEASTFYATAVGSFLATLQPRSARHHCTDRRYRTVPSSARRRDSDACTPDFDRLPRGKFAIARATGRRRSLRIHSTDLSAHSCANCWIGPFKGVYSLFYPARCERTALRGCTFARRSSRISGAACRFGMGEADRRTGSRNGHQTIRYCGKFRARRGHSAGWLRNSVRKEGWSDFSRSAS
jgi:hypothetical protein